MRPDFKSLTFFFFIALLMLIQCTSGPVAGGTTDSENARIGAVVVYGNEPVQKAEVRLRPSTYIMDGRSNTEVVNTCTNDSGYFQAEIKESGHYTLEIRKNDSLAATATIEISSQNNSTIHLDTLSLALTGRMEGNLPETQSTATVYILGLEHKATIDSSGFFTFQSLAPGNYSLLVTTDHKDTLLIPEIIIKSSQSSLIQNIDLQQKSWTEVIPETYKSDSLTIEAFLDSQKINMPYFFDQITSVSNGRIRTLNLAGLGISSLHSAIGSCSFLYTLSVSNNNLTSLPPELGKCRYLSALTAEHNAILSIPVEITRLPFLEFLKLSYNSIKELPDSVYFMPRLRKLSIGANPIDSLPALVGNLHNLEQLDIFQCNLDKIPDEIGNLPKLQQIWAGNNLLTSLPQSFSKLSQLEILQLSFNELSTLPEEIGSLSSLKNLALYDNELTSLPLSVLKLAQIQDINVDRNNLCTIPAEVAQWLENHTDSDWLSRQKSCP